MLRHLPFTDLYLGEHVAHMAGVPGTHDPLPVPGELELEISELRAKCASVWEQHGRDDFSIKYQNTSYRASVIQSLADTVFVLRRFPESIPQLQQLGIHQKIIENLLEPNITGLIVVSGTFGQGKTTTASSLVVSRLAALGGVAITIEDPPEMPLEGQHGLGVCYQTWAGKGGFADACRKATRWAPSIIFLGEVRDGETAIEALRASINGRLVVCTTHSDNVTGAIERIFALASSETSSEDTTQLLAHGLKGVLHQRLEIHGDRKQVFLTSLWVDGPDETGIRSTITSRRINQLQSFVDQQRNQMLAQRNLFVK